MERTRRKDWARFQVVTDEQSEYAEQSGPRRVFCDGRLDARKFDRSYPMRQDERYKDRQ